MPKRALHNVAIYHGAALGMQIVIALCMLSISFAHLLHSSDIQDPQANNSRNASTSDVHSVSSSTASSNRKVTLKHSEFTRFGDQNPAYFGGSYHVYPPTVPVLKSEPACSVILLGPWNASQGWGYLWMIDPKWSSKYASLEPHDFAGVQRLRRKMRIVDVVGRNMDGVAHAWYGYTDWNNAAPVPYDVDAAIAYVHSLIEMEYAIVGDYRRIALAGLSQGADLALEAAIRFPHQLGMVISMRGALQPWRRVAKKNYLAAPSGTPFIFSAGGSDHYYTAAISNQCCVAMKTTETHVFLRTFSGLDHESWSKREWKLTIDSLSLLWSTHPTYVASQLAHTTEWTPCSGQVLCFDQEGFLDEYGYPCSHWKGYDCATANPNAEYTQVGEDAVLQNCRKACGVC